jgi:hypothetical protein
MRIAGVSTALVLLVTALSYPGYSQDGTHPTYEVANLIKVDEVDSRMYAHELSVKIRALGVQNSVASGKGLWECCTDRKRHANCAVVYSMVSVASNKVIIVHIYVEEYLPQGPLEGKVKELTCSPSPLEKCYEILLNRIAQAVKEHDQRCHSGKKCHVANEQFVED